MVASRVAAVSALAMAATTGRNSVSPNFLTMPLGIFATSCCVSRGDFERMANKLKHSQEVFKICCQQEIQWDHIASDEPA